MLGDTSRTQHLSKPSTCRSYIREASARAGGSGWNDQATRRRSAGGGARARVDERRSRTRGQPRTLELADGQSCNIGLETCKTDAAAPLGLVQLTRAPAAACRSWAIADRGEAVEEIDRGNGPGGREQRRISARSGWRPAGVAVDIAVGRGSNNNQEILMRED